MAINSEIYVGVTFNSREVFECDCTPTQETHGDKYVYVIGPFDTYKGAKFMADFGRNNPHCQHVSDAERLARHYDT